MITLAASIATVATGLVVAAPPAVSADESITVNFATAGGTPTYRA
jgi:hypothetical protein